MTKHTQVCNFCRKTVDGKGVVASPGVMICAPCARAAQAQVDYDGVAGPFEVIEGGAGPLAVVDGGKTDA